jgi:chorismate-pyruvate lyase
VAHRAGDIEIEMGDREDRRAPGRDVGRPARKRKDHVVAEELVARHFIAQDALPDDVENVELRALNSFLRALLLTDGTVSRTLEAETLHAVEVEPVEQEDCEPPGDIAGHLQLAAGERCLRRRVVMHIATATPSVWAESYVVPERLPEAFLAALTGNSQGIGGSLQQLKLESARELLWFGLSTPPPWPRPIDTPAGTLRRAYLILTGGRPALLITEDFALQENGGVLSLAGTGREAGARAQ